MWLARNVLSKDGFFEDFLEIIYKSYVIRVSRKSYDKKFICNSPTLKDIPVFEQLSLFDFNF